jgi:ribosome maturation factor RimP
LQYNEIEAIVAPELDTLGFELVKLEVVGSASNPVVRLYIDRAGGVTISDCALVSRTVGVLLEEADPFPGRYLLEVSSPGSNRPLVTVDHFEAHKGKAAKVVARAEGERITYTGTIASCINDVVTLSTADGDVSVHLEDIISAQLVHQEYKIDKKRRKEKRSKKRRGGS